MLRDQRKKRGQTKAKPGSAGLTLIQSRLFDVACGSDAPQEITYQHSLLCQTALPYRAPPPGAAEWTRRQGNASLLVEAGKVLDEETGEWSRIGLPWGPKARLVLMHLNSEAVKTRSPHVDVGESLTAFVKRLGLDTGGRTLRTIKEQVGALSAATIRMSFSGQGAGRQVNAHIVRGFDLWPQKDERQRVLWPSWVDLSLDYFESLTQHAVPLDEQAIGALSHSAMSLDIYAWLAQRLHRIPPGTNQFIAWPMIRAQFGPDYGRLNKFREVFMVALRQVVTVYPAAVIDVTAGGLTLHHSAPPVTKTRIGGATLPR